jgi:hypothetical protein
MMSGWLESTSHALVKECPPKDIFNADETRFSYHYMPGKTLSFKGKQYSGGKKSKETAIVMVGCNADGSEKLPLFVTGKYLNPCCFKNVTKLPVEYSANGKAWMTSRIFSDWLLALKKCFICQKRKIALIISNCPAHSVDIKLTAIHLVFCH